LYSNSPFYLFFSLNYGDNMKKGAESQTIPSLADIRLRRAKTIKEAGNVHNAISKGKISRFQDISVSEAIVLGLLLHALLLLLLVPMITFRTMKTRRMTRPRVLPLSARSRVLPSAALSRIPGFSTIVVADSSRATEGSTYGVSGGQPVLAVPTMRAKILAQCDGLGVGWLPRHRVGSLLKNGTLVEKQMADPREPNILYAGWRGDHDGRALGWWLEKLKQSYLATRLVQGSDRFV
jgi:hypothetical protein